MEREELIRELERLIEECKRGARKAAGDSIGARMTRAAYHRGEANAYCTMEERLQRLSSCASAPLSANK